MTILIDLPNKPTLSSAHQETLRQQNIDQDSPSTILRDFMALIEFIGPKGIQVTGQHHLLPLRCLSDLNARMTFPLQLGLKRPQQKSYPHINGLYLLLRSTGLTRLEADGPKLRLVLDEAVLSSWAQLSLTEQYFTLLESWLLRADPGVVGDSDGLFRFDHPLQGWAYLFKQIPDRGLIVGGNKQIEDDLRYHPKLHNLALLELFGFVTVQPNPPKPKAGWQIGRIWRTPLGESVLELLRGVIKSNIHNLIPAHDIAYIPFGTLQPVIQPYFSDWQHNLVIPESQFQPGLHIFKVSLGKNLWRTIAVPSDTPLDFLANTILDAYEFGHDHLDRFTYTDRFGVPRHVNHPYLEEAPSTEEVRVGDLPLVPGDTLTYLFDFGDSWRFKAQLERIDTPDAEIASPVVLESRGKAPEQYPTWDEW